VKEKNPKEIFDKAYSHLLAGEIKKAAVCFEYIVKNPLIFNDHLVRLAQQRILWYCVPLDIIFAEMEHNFPVDIYSIVVDLFSLDGHYNKTGIEPILTSIENYLAKMSDCIRVGKNFWIDRTVIEKLASRVALDVINNANPVSLEAIFKKEWPEYCNDHPSFPDHYSEAALGEALQNFNVKVLADKFVVSEKILPTALGNFARMIGQAGQPLCLNDQIPQLFPGLAISPEDIPIIENYLAHNLDHRFIEYIPGYYLTRQLIKFDAISFDDLFSDQYSPFPTKRLLKEYFPDRDITHLTLSINTLVQSQLQKNPHLVPIGEGTWFSRSRFDAFHGKVIQALYGQYGAVSLDDLLKLIAPPGLQSKQRYQFQEVIHVGLRADDQAIQVTQNHWLHIGKINNLLDKAYTYLLEVSQASIEKIVSAVLSGTDIPTPVRAFYVTFEENLRKDPRFTLVPNILKIWRAIPEGQRDNEIIYQLLSEVKFPLTEDQVVDKLHLIDPEYNLADDPRFQPFPNGRWGLSFWVWLNDYAYEYLLRTRQHLHIKVVIGLVCKEQGFNRKFAFFFPDEDPRFAQDDLNRWFCRYQLTTADLDLLFAELDQYAGIGRKLDVLIQKVLRLHPDATNAAEALPSDPRIIHIDNLWYSRRKAFYELSPMDVEKIYTYLSELPVDTPAISIQTIGLNALNWDGRLTNAPDLLIQDNRFVEKHKGFWVLSTWLSPDYDRTSQGGVAVFGPTSVTGTEDHLPVEIPTILTRRRRREGTKPLADVKQKKFYHTLSQLDILHGNIRISGLLKEWIPKTAKTILLMDDEANKLVAYVDETHTILNIRDWTQKRELTYGDKIYLQPGSQPTSLFIRPYGKRDERVYQEALRHQDIEKLIAEARQVNMTYHDLMIEMMEAFGIPLHREDIFQLVDYRRTATRDTIFEILSLTDCPYEELRYFIPEKKGLWSFDRQRKKAFDMKMKELLDENASLKGQITLLSENKGNEQDITAKLSHLKQKVQSLEQSIQKLNNEKSSLSVRIQALEAEKSRVDQFNQQLKEKLTQVQQHLTELIDAHTNASIELERLHLEEQAYQEKESQFRVAQTELEHLRLEQKGFLDKASQIVVLQDEMDNSQKLLAQLQTESAQQATTLKERIALLKSELDVQQGQLKRAEAAYTASVAQVADLSASRAQLQAELESQQIQAQGEISTLHDQLTNLTDQVAELTDQLQIIANRLASEEAEKQAVQVQLDQTCRQFQISQARVAQDSANQVQKLAMELEAREAAIQALENQLVAVNTEKAAIIEDSATEQARLTQQLSALQNQLDTLSQTHVHQTRDLAALVDRQKQLDRALATPLGRLFARLQGLKKQPSLYNSN
jgi:hypothetical protein